MVGREKTSEKGKEIRKDINLILIFHGKQKTGEHVQENAFVKLVNSENMEAVRG